MTFGSWSQEHLDEMLLEGLVDWVDPAWVCSGLMDDVTNPEERTTVAISLVRELIEGGWMVPGDLTASGRFVPWRRSTDESIAKIEAEWLGRFGSQSPPPGEIVLLQNTHEGDRRGRRYQDRLSEPPETP